MAMKANYNRANTWMPIFARGSNHTCTVHYWCTRFRFRGCKQRRSVKSPKGDRTQTFRVNQMSNVNHSGAAERGSWIRVPTLMMMLTSDSPVSFRTVGLILLFSQYLSKVDVPMIAYKDKKWKVFQYPLFKLFSVSRCPAQQRYLHISVSGTRDALSSRPSLACVEPGCSVSFSPSSRSFPPHLRSTAFWPGPISTSTLWPTLPGSTCHTLVGSLERCPVLLLAMQAFKLGCISARFHIDTQDPADN